MITKILLRLSSKSRVFAFAKKVYQKSRDIIRDHYYSSQPINDRMIIFEAFRSTKYADSPRAIYEYMLNSSEYADFSFVWAFEDPDKFKHIAGPRTRLVKHESREYYRAFARSKYWVVNGWISLRVKKRSGQIALQCWHGTPLKRLRYDIIETANTTHREAGLRDNDLDMIRYDYLLSPSKFTTEVFTSAFNLKKINKRDIIFECGYPRNDILTNFTKSDVARIKKGLSLPGGKKVLLYAPTWRDDQLVEGKGYAYKNPVDFRYLYEHLKDDYILLFRAHNLVADNFDFSEYEGFIYDVSGHDDIGELYTISDVLITDYSSVFFDYAILNRPILFFMYDLDHYQKELRGFYLDTHDLPGSVVKAEYEVVELLSDLKGYISVTKAKHKKFSETYNYLEDGKATQRVVKKVFKDK